jgi:hypothetical protein
MYTYTSIALPSSPQSPFFNPCRYQIKFYVNCHDAMGEHISIPLRGRERERLSHLLYLFCPLHSNFTHPTARFGAAVKKLLEFNKLWIHSMKSEWKMGE